MSGQLRHCMIVHAYYPVGETRVQRQAQALVDRGVRVNLICLRAAGELRRENVGGVDVSRVPVRRHKGRGTVVQLAEYLAFLLAASVRLIALLFRYRFDAVQVHNLPDFLVLAAAPAKPLGAAVILDLHDLMPELFAARFETDMADWRVRMILAQERLAARFADHVVTVTHEWRETLVGRGIPRNKIDVVMNLADERLFTPRLPPPANERSELRLIYHGTFTHRYGVDVAVSAVALVRQHRPDVKLDLLGAGETRDELVALVKKLGLEDHVALSQGMVAAEDLPEHLARADIGLVPNRSNIFTEGILPTKLLEYVAMGIPVVASRTSGVASYFDETMIRYVPPGDAGALAAAITDLAGDPEGRAVQVSAANRFNQTYNWATHGEQYVALVRRLAPRPRQ